jgi:hypothetical protein
LVAIQKSVLPAGPATSAGLYALPDDYSPAHAGTTTTTSTRTRDGTWTKNGNTVTHQGTTTGERRGGGHEWKPRYGLFGDRERPHAGGHGGGSR